MFFYGRPPLVYTAKEMDVLPLDPADLNTVGSLHPPIFPFVEYLVEASKPNRFGLVNQILQIMRKILIPSSVFAILMVLSLEVFAQLPSAPPGGGNQKSIVRQYMGAVAYIEVTYNSPDVAGREGQIWGQLVPYGLNNLGFGASTADNPSPWRAGANENTTIEFSHPVKVQGNDLAAGRYGFHVIPQEEGPWTLIFSRETNAWGSFFYTPEEDVLRVEATPEESAFNEYLTFVFSNRKVDETTLELQWENLKVPFTISLQNANDVTLAAIESDLKGNAGFNSNGWVTAANWALGAGYQEKALTWADAAINLPFIGQRNFNTLSTKAAILRAMGKNQESFVLMDEAIKMPGVGAFQIHAYGRQLIAAGEKEKALEVFKYNHKQNEGAWPTNYGLARGYSATGDYKSALKHLEVAKTKVPAGDTVNPPVIEANIQKLKNGEDIN